MPSTCPVNDCVTASLLAGGIKIPVEIATPGMMGETRRLRVQMGNAWSKDHPQRIAHDSTVQKVRAAKVTDENGTALEGKGRVIRLPVKCEGTVQTKRSDIP